MKKIVLINQSSGYLAIDIANAFVMHYDRVVLIAGIIKPLERELNPLIKIQKIIKYNRTSNFKRIFTWIWGSLQIFFLLFYKYRDFEVFYTTNPPMACFSSILKQNRFSILIYDIYPDALKNIGINEKNVIYKCWSDYNRKLFKRAAKIFTLSKGMAEQLTNYTTLDKIKVIPNWSGSDNFSPVPKEENPFIKKQNLDNKFIVLYSGNIGFTHCVDTIVEVAKILENDRNICFLFIGEGGKKDNLIQKSKNYNLNNCIFLSWQPSEFLRYSLASADIAVITLNDENAALSVPSKTYNLLAVGTPLLCIVPENSELVTLVRKYQNGICFTKDKIMDIAQYIAILSRDKDLQKKLSCNSVKASRDYSYANAQNYL